jgi:SsrA-binding protein
VAEKLIATNREAVRDYVILETCEAGIELRGTEVKSLRENRASLKDSFARIERGECCIYNLHISPYSHGNISNPDPRRIRRLLLHKHQVERFQGQISQKGLTLIPLRLYFNQKGLVKAEVAICKRRKLYDKREQIRKETIERETERALKGSV